MQKLWLNPKQIEVSVVLNNRQMNQNYIADLAQSMTDKGFLPEFPIDVVPAGNLPNIDTALDYICACGAHRTKAAIAANLEAVLVHIHDEKEEAFTERMHLDNFQFDPAVNSGIGQAFTNKEKRAAVHQLLLLPKFFEMTNVALEKQWRIPQTNLRRWRDEVLKMLETNHPNLRHWGVSDGRLKRIRELQASAERVDGDGKVVKIRKPPVDAPDDEKEKFLDQIEDDAADWEETDWEEIRTHVVATFDVDNKWYIERDVTMKQLQTLHQLILAKDKTFLEAVKNSVQKAKELEEKSEAAIDRVNQVFKKRYAPQEDKYSKAYKSMRKNFVEFVQKHDERYEQFHMDKYDYDYDFRQTPESADIAVLHDEICEAIESEAEWLQDFLEFEKEKIKNKRKAVDANWRKQRTALLTAIEEYPRTIEASVLLYHCDDHLRRDMGTMQKIVSSEAPSAKKFTATIEAEADWFKRSAYAISKDVKFIAEIPEKKSMIDSVFEADESAPVEEPEFTITAEDLHGLPLRDIVEHVRERVIYIPDLVDENELRSDLATLLGKASRGMVGTQLYFLMDHAMFLLPENPIEGSDVEKEAEATDE